MLSSHLHSHPHPANCTCKQHLDEQTQSQVTVIEDMQKILDQSYSLMIPPYFQRLFQKSFIALYNLNEKHWYRAEFHSVRAFTSIMESWVRKYKSNGKQMILYYLSQAMNNSLSDPEEAMDYVEKAKIVAEEDLYDAKHLIPKICVIEGDVLSSCEPDSALQSYQYAIEYCRKNCLFIPTDQNNTFDLKQLMVEALFKSAMMTKSLESEPEEVLQLLEETKKYAVQIQGNKSYLINQLQTMCQTEKTKIKEKQPKHEQETMCVQQKIIQIGHGMQTRQLVLRINYVKPEQRLIIIVQDKQNQETRSKSIPLPLKNINMIDNIKNNIEDWVNIDKNLKITVDEKSLERVSVGETIASSKHQDKHRMIKIIKKSEMFKNVLDNSGSVIIREGVKKEEVEFEGI